MKWVDKIIIFFIAGVSLSKYLDFSLYIIIPIITSIILYTIIIIGKKIELSKNQTIYISLICSLLIGIAYNYSYNTAKINIKHPGSNIKNQITKEIEKKYTHNQDSEFIKAIILGDKKELPKELKHSYSQSGAMHILALSGLHTGIIYSMINLLLYILNFSYKKRILKIILSGIILIIYCHITGYSPSVLRATIMIICYNLITFYCRGYSKYTILLFTALILLLINPNNISSIGFMLSFSAMIGIIVISPIITKALEIRHLRNKIYKYITSLVSISISCQITTLPITLYIFGNYSPTFIITNLIAIPLATLIIYTFILSALLAPIPILSDFMEKVLSILITAINNFISFAAS